jgi:hypothetical protein
MFKAFQVLLVTCLVIFTAVGAIVLVSGMLRLLMPVNGVYAFGGGLRVGLLEAVLIAVLLLVAAVFLVSRKHRLK